MLFKKIGETIKQLRESNDFSQQQVADALWINRASLSLVEKGERGIKPQELKKLAELFDIPIEMVVSGKSIKMESIKTFDEKKFKNLFLYILNKCWSKPNIGKTVLYKLLYFCEFDYFEKYKKHISGIPFIKLPMGPAPYNFNHIVAKMEKKNEIIPIQATYKWYLQSRYVANAIYENTFSKEELGIINQVIQQYSDCLAKDISEHSHKDIPRKETADMNIIDYSLVKKREYPYSIIAREQKKEQAFTEIKVSWMFSDLADEPDLYEKYR